MIDFSTFARRLGENRSINICESVFVNPFAEMWKFSKLKDCELMTLVHDFVACFVPISILHIIRVWSIGSLLSLGIPQPPHDERESSTLLLLLLGLVWSFKSTKSTITDEIYLYAE